MIAKLGRPRVGFVIDTTQLQELYLTLVLLLRLLLSLLITFLLLAIALLLRPLSLLLVHLSELLIVLFGDLFDIVAGLLPVVLAVILVLVFLLLLSAVPRLVVGGIFIRFLSVLSWLLDPLVLAPPVTLLGSPVIVVSGAVVSGREVGHLDRILLFEEPISRALENYFHFKLYNFNY